MLTPLQQAQKIFDSFYYLFPDKFRHDFGYIESVECSIVTVKHIIESKPSFPTGDIESSIDYWKQVEKELSDDSLI